MDQTGALKHPKKREMLLPCVRVLHLAVCLCFLPIRLALGNVGLKTRLEAKQDGGC